METLSWHAGHTPRLLSPGSVHRDGGQAPAFAVRLSFWILAASLPSSDEQKLMGYRAELSAVQGSPTHFVIHGADYVVSARARH